MDELTTHINIEDDETVNADLERIENDPQLMLRLVDLIFFLDNREDVPS